MAVAGKAQSKEAEKLVSFTELQSTTATTTKLKAGEISGVQYYLYPNLLIGILFMLFVLSIMIFSFLLLMNVQTPTVFSAEKIDFGKIEK